MKGFWNFVALLLVIGAIVICVVFTQHVAQYTEGRRLALEASKARAEADRLAAQVDLAQAQAAVENARGERAVLESAARAVDNNTRLVTWYSLRGDLRALVACLALAGMGICAVIAVRVLRGGRDAQDTTR